jgi:hypothetical protein
MTVKLTPDELRYEWKLVCPPDQLDLARSWLRLHPEAFRLSRPARRVNRLYFDTRDLACLNAHLAGLARRFKVRLHWYGDDWTDVRSWLEIKAKVTYLGHKPRCPLPPLDLTRPWSEIVPTIQGALDRDLQVALQTVTQPAMLGYYWRELHVTPDEQIKVTLDFDQVAFDQRFGPRPNLHIRLPLTPVIVIEFKGRQGQGDRMAEMMSQFPLRQVRNSKYVGWALAALYSQ